jgi:hypothetical protein
LSTAGLSMRSKNWRAYALKGFHVTPLTFGIQSIKHQAGFARPTGAGEHGQFTV